MSEKFTRWPLPPKNAAHTLHGLAIAMNDAIQHLNGSLPEREQAKLMSLVESTEVISCELARFFASRRGEDHKHLEEICARYLEEERK